MNTHSRIRSTLVVVLLLSAILTMWTISVLAVTSTELPTQDLGDLASLLFGAASVAMFLLSFFIGVLAIFGWQSLREAIKERVDAAVTKELERVSREIRARHLTGLGFMIGELSHELNSLEPTNKERIEYSVELCRTAYDELAKLNGKDLLLAQNNLVFYSSIRNKKSDAGFILDLARDLRRKSTPLGRTDFLLSYCRAVICYSTDSQEKEEVRAILEEFEKSSIPDSQKKEARLYLASFPKQSS